MKFFNCEVGIRFTQKNYKIGSPTSQPSKGNSPYSFKNLLATASKLTWSSSLLPLTCSLALELRTSLQIAFTVASLSSIDFSKVLGPCSSISCEQILFIKNKMVDEVRLL